MSQPDFTQLRLQMVGRQLQARGIRDVAVLDAFRSVPREAFVAKEYLQQAYSDRPLPIGHSQTISQPYVVALMVEALGLSKASRVLEIGTGSGYAASILSHIAAEVYTVERHAALADFAREQIERLGYQNVSVVCGDGSQGWLDAAPYDGIVVAAGAPEIPESLKQQLAVGGSLVIPVGGSSSQSLRKLTRVSGDQFERHDLGGVRFVPLIGRQGWQE